MVVLSPNHPGDQLLREAARVNLMLFTPPTIDACLGVGMLGGSGGQGNKNVPLFVRLSYYCINITEKENV